MGSTPSERLALSAVQTGAQHFGRRMGALRGLHNTQSAPEMITLLVPHPSLDSREGRRRLETLLPEPLKGSPPRLSPDTKSTVARL